MPKLELSEEQVLELLLQLSPEGKRKALEILKQDAEWEQVAQEVRKRWKEICAERGIDWERLSDEEREALVDEWLHQR
jgi:arsenate reductase-like glutaredoxin family protein